MSRVRIAEEAEADLVEIWAFIAQDSIEAADQFLERVYDTCQTLARSPGIGHDRSDLVRGIRSFPVGTYLVFYRASGNRSRQGIEWLSGSTPSLSSRLTGGESARTAD